MIAFLVAAVWVFFWLGSGGWRVPTILTLATLALCYILGAVATYWTDVLVYGYTTSEAKCDALRWPFPNEEV